jgi:hypothetical protein
MRNFAVAATQHRGRAQTNESPICAPSRGKCPSRFHAVSLVMACQSNNLATSDNYFKFKVSPKPLISRFLGAMPLLKKPLNN